LWDTRCHLPSFILLLVFFGFFLVSSALILLGFSFSIKTLITHVRCTPLDCGFLSLGEVQSSFGINYYVVLLVFILFDLEVVFFLGFICTGAYEVIMFFFFFLIVFLTYYLELYLGSLR